VSATRAEPSQVALRAAQNPWLISLAVISFTFAAYYFRAFIFPDIPLAPNGDQLGFLHAGSRLAVGELPYRDYFQIVPPGTDLVYAALIRLFGLKVWIPHLVMAALAAATAGLMTLIAMRVLRGWVIFLPALLLVGFLLPVAGDATHHWFSTMTALAALVAMVDEVSLGRIGLTRIGVAGALCGLTACFTQTKGAALIAGFGVWLAWNGRRRGAKRVEWPRECGILCATAAGVFLAVNAYFIAAAGVRRWLFCVIIFPIRYYPAPPLNNWRVLLHTFEWSNGIARWVSFPFIYAAVPFACIVFLLVFGRRQESRPASQRSPAAADARPDENQNSWPQLVLIAVTGIAIFLSVAAAPSAKRLATVGPPALILLAWMLNRPGELTHVLKVALSIAATVMTIGLPLRTQTHWRAFLELPAGRTAFHDERQYEEYEWLLEHTRPGQFFFGTQFYTQFHLRNPAPIDGFDTSEYTRPAQVQALFAALATHPVPMIMLPSTKKYPLATGLPSDHLGPFRDYLMRNYRFAEIMPTGDEVWEKLHGPGSEEAQP
jgi:hypothetical protein